MHCYKEDGQVQASSLMFLEMFSRAEGWYEPLMTALYEQGHPDLVKELDPEFVSSCMYFNSISWYSKNLKT
jgi:hypothetical protein